MATLRAIAHTIAVATKVSSRYASTQLETKISTKTVLYAQALVFGVMVAALLVGRWNCQLICTLAEM